MTWTPEQIAVLIVAFLGSGGLGGLITHLVAARNAVKKSDVSGLEEKLRRSIDDLNAAYERQRERIEDLEEDAKQERIERERVEAELANERTKRREYEHRISELESQVAAMTELEADVNELYECVRLLTEQLQALGHEPVRRPRLRRRPLGGS